MSKDQGERVWSYDRGEQIQMQMLYLACLGMKGQKYTDAEALTNLYTTTLKMNLSGSPLPAFKAQLVFEAAMQE